MRLQTRPPLLLTGLIAVQILLLSHSCAIATTIVDDTFYEGADGSVAVRYVDFDLEGAHFDGEYSGIDYPATALPAEGTVEILIRTGRSGDVILDTRGADPRLSGDLLLSIASGPYGSSTLQDAVAGQVFFTIDPDGGVNPGLLPGVLSTTIITDGAWHIISVSYGSGGLALYIDGVLEDAAPAITAQPIDSIVTLGDFDDQLVFAAFSFLGELLRFRTSDVQNDVTPLCEGLSTLDDDCQVITAVPPAVDSGRVLHLDQNMPNPFNPTTTIAFELSERSIASLGIYDVAGRLIAVLLRNEFVNEGRHEARWCGTDDAGHRMPSGTYFYRLTVGGCSESRRMVLVE